jgi:hypothetical protein
MDFAFPSSFVKLCLVDDFQGPILAERCPDKPDFTISTVSAALDGGDLGLFHPFGYFFGYGHGGGLFAEN